MAIELNGQTLSLEMFRRIVDDREPVRLSDSAKTRVQKARAVVERVSQSDDKVYSINTGFGILSKVKIEKKRLQELQVNLVRSHAAGVGEPHSERESRAMLLLRANVLAKGNSGVRVELIEFLVEMLNRAVHPVIPQKGSVGSSGDLAPLAHLACVLLGEGEAFAGGKRQPAVQALSVAGLKPFVLDTKEGLSLINGTQQMTALGALFLLHSEELWVLADLICSTTLEGVLGTPRAFSEWVQELRPYEGQLQTASRLRKFLQDSEIYKSHIHCDRVQDPYSIRCAPQVHGACGDLLKYARQVLSIELNAATDNPLVNPDTGEITSSGNFHGQPLAFALDMIGMALAELGNISERRTAKLLNPVFSELPTFLVKDEGLNSGFMIPQYTAASLVVENRLLAHPASTDSIPTNNDKEDHNSMGSISARKLRGITENLSYILAIEALAACQALEFRKPLKPGKGPQFLYEQVRSQVAPYEKDRYFSSDIECIAKMISSGELFEKLLGSGILT